MKTKLRLSRLILMLSLASLAACSATRQPAAETGMGHESAMPEAPAAGVPSGAGYVGPGAMAEKAEAKAQPVKVVMVKDVNTSPFQPITIRVVGAGAAPYIKTLTPTQRKLLAIRAARLDAFRQLAEQVQGMRLVGNSTVSNMIATSDSFRAYVDAYLRGVNVVSTEMKPDGASEAVAELVLDQEFYRQYRQALEKNGGDVMKSAQEAPTEGVMTTTPKSKEAASTELCQGEGCVKPNYGSNFYVSH